MTREPPGEEEQANFRRTAVLPDVFEYFEPECLPPLATRSRRARSKEGDKVRETRSMRAYKVMLLGDTFGPARKQLSLRPYTDVCCG